MTKINIDKIYECKKKKKKKSVNEGDKYRKKR